MSWLRQIHKGKASTRTVAAEAPPGWTPAPEQSHTLGLFNEATDDEYESAEAFCARYPVEPAKLLPSDVVDRIDTEGCKAWTMDWPHSARFVGRVQDGEKGSPAVTRVTTGDKCCDVCLLSNLPILAGLYEIQGKSGVYYEVAVKKMAGIIALGACSICNICMMCFVHVGMTGTACRPYPDWRFPGWNRGSAGLHLDDMRKFFEDPNGGRDYHPLLSSFSAGDFIGCGYDFSASSIFFTYNGQRLPDAFGGVYVPRTQQDVYAAIGVEGSCDFEVNFGGEPFKWKEGNEWAWRVEGHVGRLSATSSRAGAVDDELPSYEEVRRQR